MTLQKMVDYLRWLAKPPHLRDLWTYCGVWMLDGIAANLPYRHTFVHILDATPAGVLAVVCAILLVALLLNRMGFPGVQALVISLSGMCIAAANWPTINLDLTTSTSVVLTFGGVIASLPLFCRGMETIRSKIE